MNLRKIFDVVIGSAVARKLNHQTGDSIILAHGDDLGQFRCKHDDSPFKIVGVLAPTGTPIDRSVYISPEAMTAMHEGLEGPSSKSSRQSTKITEITSFS